MRVPFNSINATDLDTAKTKLGSLETSVDHYFRTQWILLILMRVKKEKTMKVLTTRRTSTILPI